MGSLLFLLGLVSLFGFGFLALGVSTVEDHNSRYGRRIHFKFRPMYAALAVVGFFLFTSLNAGMVTVDAGTVGVVKRFGDPIGVLQPGLHFIRPIGDTVTPIAIQRRIVKSSETAASSDLQVVFAEVTLGYHVDPAYATYILTELNDEAETRVIVPAILEAIKAETAQYEVQALVKNRAQVRDGIENRVKARLLSKHIIPEDVSITNFKFSDQYEQSIEQKQVAEQNAEKAKNVLEEVKTEAQQKIAQAEGEAAALKAQKEQITPELLQLRMIEMLSQKWDGALPQNYYGGTAPLPIVEALRGVKR
jgi:prohibitin 2